MPTNYPGAIDAFTNPDAGAGDTLDDPPHDDQHADANDAIEAIETELGINPRGSEADVRARLDAIEAAADEHPGTPVAMATGKDTHAVDSSTEIEEAVAFPAGRFTAAPVVTLTPARSSGTVDVVCGMTAVTSEGFNIRAIRLTGGSLSITFHWVAVQYDEAP